MVDIGHFETLFTLLLLVSITTILLGVRIRWKTISFKAGLKPETIRRFVFTLKVVGYASLGGAVFSGGLAAILLPRSVPFFGAWSFFAGLSVLLSSIFIYLMLFAASARRSVPVEETARPD